MATKLKTNVQAQGQFTILRKIREKEAHGVVGFSEEEKPKSATSGANGASKLCEATVFHAGQASNFRAGQTVVYFESKGTALDIEDAEGDFALVHALDIPLAIEIEHEERRK